jgi:hypothetical protein
MQDFISQNVVFTRNEAILEESLYESKIGRLLRQRQAVRAARINHLQATLASFLDQHHLRHTRPNKRTNMA